MTAPLTSRGQRFQHHHAAAYTDRGENHDPTGTRITAQALNGGLDHPARNKRTVPSEAMVTLAAIRLMLHRLAHPNRRRLPAL